MDFKLIAAHKARIYPNGSLLGTKIMGGFILLVSLGCIPSLQQGKFPLLAWAAISTLGFCALFASYAMYLDKGRQQLSIKARNLLPVKQHSIAFADIAGLVVDEVLLERRRYRLYVKLQNGDRYILVSKGHKAHLETLAQSIASFINKPVYKTYQPT